MMRLAFAAAIAALAAPAAAQDAPNCAPWTVMKPRLAERYGELPIGGGIVNPTTIATVFAAPDGATWSLVVVDRSGRACLIATGRDWEPGRLPEPKKPEERS
jgi:hypothetical protein